MELSIILRLQNDSGFISSNYKNEFPGIAYSLSILLGIGSIVGTVGNILTIIAVFNFRQLNFGGNMFVANLAFADLCVSGFVSPMNIVGIIVGELFFLENFYLCRIIASVCLISCICSLLNICVVSLNRLVYIVFNRYYNTLFAKSKCQFLCLLVWVLAFFLQMPNYLGWGGHVYDRKTLSCIWDRMNARSFTQFFAGFLILTPIIITAISYSMIFSHWRSSTKKIQASVSAAARSKTVNKSMHLVRMLFLIFFTFVLCWAPYAAIVLADEFDTYSIILHGVLVIVAHLNSSFNAVLYGFTNPQFRAAYFRLMGITFLNNKIHGTVNPEVSKLTEV